MTKVAVFYTRAKCQGIVAEKYPAPDTGVILPEG